jgi:hypothetical protein
MTTRRVTYHNNVGELSVRDVADMMETSRGHHIIIGIFTTEKDVYKKRDVYLNVLHGIGDRKYVWLNIEDVHSKWTDLEPKEQFIGKYLNGVNYFPQLKRLWVMDDIEDLSSFLHDYKALRSIGEDYR